MQAESQRSLSSLFEQRDELRLSNLDLARLTKLVDPAGRGLSYQTLRRIENGENVPRRKTCHLIELTLDAFSKQEVGL